jgi:hypothetical protein
MNYCEAPVLRCSCGNVDAEDAYPSLSSRIGKNNEEACPPDKPQAEAASAGEIQ